MSIRKRLIAAVRLKNVTSRFATERLKNTTAYPLSAGAFRGRRARRLHRVLSMPQVMRASITGFPPLRPMNGDPASQVPETASRINRTLSRYSAGLPGQP